MNTRRFAGAGLLVLLVGFAGCATEGSRATSSGAPLDQSVPPTAQQDVPPGGSQGNPPSGGQSAPPGDPQAGGSPCERLCAKVASLCGYSIGACAAACLSAPDVALIEKCESELFALLECAAATGQLKCEDILGEEEPPPEEEYEPRSGQSGEEPGNGQGSGALYECIDVAIDFTECADQSPTPNPDPPGKCKDGDCSACESACDACMCEVGDEATCVEAGACG